MVIEERYRTLWRRIFAVFFDIIALLPLGWLDVFLWNTSDSVPALIAWLLLFIAATVGYEVGFLWYCGQTPGRMLTGVIVRDYDRDGGITLCQALIRHSVPTVMYGVTLPFLLSNMLSGDIMNRGFGHFPEDMSLLTSPVFWLGMVQIGWILLEIITALFNRKRRALHDYLAHTVVERTPTASLSQHLRPLILYLALVWVIDMFAFSFLPEDRNRQVMELSCHGCKRR